MMRFSALLFGFALAVSVSAPALSQDQTLADIRQELQFLYVDVERLKRELSTTGMANPNTGGTTFIERLNSIEAEMVRLTSKTEELENRINQVVTDGTNRIGDLEFRLVELEGGDVSKLGETTTLGGGAMPATNANTAAITPSTGGAELAMGEQADFDRAKAALESSDFRGAADLFATFTQTYTGGPLTGEAHFLRGEALASLGETTNAARAYLESYSGSPDGSRASDALFKLGASLGTLGQVSDACVTLAQVANLYPGTAAVGQAKATMQSLGCS
ncbi:MAG: tol-pal system protein YbgF [Paracoccaceae bacterium]